MYHCSEIRKDTMLNYLNFAPLKVVSPCGLMDKASPSGFVHAKLQGEDWGFESLQGRFLFSFFFKILFFYSFHS